MRRSKKNNRSSRRRTSKVPNLTLEGLRKLVLEELSGELEPVEDAASAEEYEAGKEAETLADDQDHYKELKLKEMYLKKQHAKIVKEARKVRAQKRRLKKKILRELD